ncbi:MAG: energy-coupling factor ABC transporter ATP-binding protein [bacterium]
MEKAIEIENLSYSYGDGTRALENVTLRIYRGESVCLVGPNGAGKSTLIMHLNGSLQNGDGSRVRIWGMPVVKGNLKEIRRQVGIVFQDPDDQLFSPTVFDDVAFGPMNLGYEGERVREKVRRALEAVGISPDYEGRLPHHLSFGEKKRIAIATVLSMDVSILVMDEPSSNLDPASRRSLINLLKALPLTKVVATHDLEMALEICRRVILIDGGRIVADGAAREILGNERLMEDHKLEVPLSLKIEERR